LLPSDGNESLGKQPQAAAQHHELPTHAPDGFAVVLPKIRNGFEVRRQPTRQPDQLHITLRLALQAAARLDAIQISVDINLQQRARMVRRTARRLRLRALEAHLLKFQLINEHIDNPYRIILSNVIVQTLGK
jgi:hypothetical protein